MNKNILLIVGGFLLIALLVTGALQLMFSGSDKVQEEIAERAEPKVDVLVAAKDLTAGTDLDDKNIEWQQWPKSGVFKGAVVREGNQTPTEAVSGRLKIAVAEDEPIMKTAVVTNEKGDNLAAVLGRGMRAVSFDVEDSQMVAGFVGPGNYVDIMLTYTFDESLSNALDNEDPELIHFVAENIDRRATEIILENVKVLAIDQRAQPDEENRVRLGQTVTVEVDRKGAETLALGQSVGTLSLALRGIGDDEVEGPFSKSPATTDTRMIRLDDEIYSGLLSLYRKRIYERAGENARLENNSGQISKIMRIYRGDEVQEVTVSQPIQ